MGRYALLQGSVFIVGLIIGGVVSAAKLAEAVQVPPAPSGQILGVVSLAGGEGDVTVRLGPEGPRAPITADGRFDFGGVPPGCHDLIIEGGPEDRQLFTDAACVEPDRAAIVSIIYGSPR